MEYQRDFRDNLQLVRTVLIRFPSPSSISIASPAALFAFLGGLRLGGVETGLNDAAIVGLGAVIVAGWFNRPLTRWLTPPTICLDMDQADPDPKLFPTDAEILAQRTRSFVESYFRRSSDAETLFAGGPPLDELNAPCLWDGETASVYVSRGLFLDTSEWLEHVRHPRAAMPAWRYDLLRDSTGQLFLEYLHELVHSASDPIGDIPVAWTEGVTELATRTAAAQALAFARLLGVDQEIGIKQTHKYDRYVAAISLVVLEVSNLTGASPEALIQGLVYSGCNRRGVKRFSSALVRACQIASPELEEQITKILLDPFEKLKPGTFPQTRKGDLEDVRDALLEARFLLGLNGIRRQAPPVATADPYQDLLKGMGMGFSKTTPDELTA